MRAASVGATQPSTDKLKVQACFFCFFSKIIPIPVFFVNSPLDTCSIHVFGCNINETNKERRLLLPLRGSWLLGPFPRHFPILCPISNSDMRKYTNI